MIPRCSWDVFCITLLLLNTSGVGNAILLLMFDWKWLPVLVFYDLDWNSFSTETPSYLSFPSRVEVLLSWITENNDVSSANSLAFKDNTDKSLIYIKINNGSSMEPLGTPALTSDQYETFPFNKTLSFLFLRNSCERFIKLPNI